MHYFKRLIFNILLKISRFKLRRGISIYNVRADYHLFAKIIYFLSPIEKDVLINYSTLDTVRSLTATPPVQNKRQILYLHGGAFVIGLDDLENAFIPFATKLAKITHSTVWIPDYRTAPEHEHHILGQDCLTAYTALLAAGHHPENIVIMGDSCGAALALSMIMKIRDEKLPMPSCVITISAWTDLALTGQSLYTRSDIDPMFSNDPISGFANHYLQGTSSRDPEASPFYGEYHNFPPMYMMCGGREMLHDDTTRIAKKAEEAGAQVVLDEKEDMIHIYPVFFGIIPEGLNAILRMAKFIEDVAKTQKNMPAKKTRKPTKAKN